MPWLSPVRETNFLRRADLNLFADGDQARARKMARIFGEAFETLSHFRGQHCCHQRLCHGEVWSVRWFATCASWKNRHSWPCQRPPLACCLVREVHSKPPWLVGEGWAKRMILCGERVNADTAVRIGLAEEKVATGTAQKTALELAEKVARQSPPVSICASA